MIRVSLCAFLCGLTIVIALATAALQSGNRDRGIALDAIKRECDMLEAVNGDRCRRILAHDSRPLPREVTDAPKPVPASKEAPKDAKDKSHGRTQGETPLVARAGRSAP